MCADAAFDGFGKTSILRRMMKAMMVLVTTRRNGL